MKALVSLALLALTGQQETVRFVTCPIYRDTDSGRKSGCWLAEDRATGIRYDVSLAPSKPDWNREVLAEGVVKAGSEDLCGGVTLDAVRTSVLPGACTRQMLPAEGYKGHRYVLPRRNVSPLSAARLVPPGPYAARTFRLYFDFDQAFLIYQYDDYLLDEAMTWIRAARPKAITVTGFAATQPVEVSGRRIAENPVIAKERAERVAEAFVRLGIDRRTIKVRTDLKPGPTDDPEADGLSDASRRRVEITTAF